MGMTLMAPAATFADAPDKTTEVNCDIDGESFYTPGVTIDQGAGTFEGSGSLLNCTGTYRGDPVASSGTYTVSGTWTGSCFGPGSIEFRETIHLDAGRPVTIKVKGSGTTAGGTGTATGKASAGNDFSATFAQFASPETPNQFCTNEFPLVHTDVVGNGTITGKH